MFSERYNDMNGNKKNDWLPYTIAAGLAGSHCNRRLAILYGLGV